MSSLAADDDPELGALAAIIDYLAPLDGAARARALRWAADRFTPADAPERPGVPSAVFHADGHECDASLVLGALNASIDAARDRDDISALAHRSIIRRAQDAVRAALADRISLTPTSAPIVVEVVGHA